MVQIKFGTDGWRAIIGRDYTEDNVIRVSVASAGWMKSRGYDSVVIGYDTRFGGPMFAEAAARVFGHYGIRVFLSSDFASTPMVSYGVLHHKAGLGVVITASHNPPAYNGYKLKSEYGGPSIPSEIAEVEAMIPDSFDGELPALEDLEAEDLLQYTDLEEIYYRHVMRSFDLDTIRNSGITIAYDAMYGAGQRLMKRLLPEAVFLHCEENPSFMGQAPEPIDRNLSELSDLIRNSDAIQLGIANDGDADRIGMYDEDGNFVDSHHILLLLLYYMYEHKKMNGKVIVTFSVTDKMIKLARRYGLEYEVTRIGFKYIAEIMRSENVLVGGEESGGLAVAGHIPERDGIWVGLMVLELMAKTGLSIRQLIDRIYSMVGSFSFDRDDLHIDNERKVRIIEKCRGDAFSSFGPYQVGQVEKIDGFKYLIGDNAWVLIRPSGTEPVLRIYGQAPTMQEVRQLLDAVKEEILS